jgi:glutamine synthetase
MGRDSFIERFDIWSPEQRDAAERAKALIAEHDLDVVRLSFADQHGILRGKTIVASELDVAFESGCLLTTTIVLKDTAHRTIYPVWQAGAGVGMTELEGAIDFVMVPDPTTFRVLPWAERTGWMLCDGYFQDGRPLPFSTRQIGRDAVARLGDKGYDYLCGLEVEFHLLKLEDKSLRPGQAGQPADPPEVSLLTHGFQYLTETRLDEMEPILEILRRDLLALELPLRTIECEFGPSQVEFSFDAAFGIESADTMMLFRSAVKQICRRHGYHATFMCRPHIKDLFSSGWHLHQSLYDRKTGANAFIPESADQGSSALGLQFIAGLLDNAAAACPFTTPTLNGYKRYRPFVLAPDRINWGRDNKGAMLRVVGIPGDRGSRIENRAGEPAANPYLYMASQIIGGLDGIERDLAPPPPSDTPYAEAPALPRSLAEALDALRGSDVFRAALGDTFVDYFLTIKDAEVARFLSEVTDWEQREYFEIF